MTIDGNPLRRDVVVDFFVFAGDVTGGSGNDPRDRLINVNDFTVLAGNFNQTGMTYAQGDFNYDGNVNVNDFTILAGKFNTNLPAAPDSSGEWTGSAISGDEIEFIWVDDVQGETGWRVQWSTDGVTFNDYENVYTFVGTEDPTVVRSVTLDGFERGTKYWTRIRAYSDSVSNPNGPNTSYTPKKSTTTALAPPVGLLVQRTGTTANLSWNAPLSGSNASTLVIQRSTNGYAWTTIDTIAATQTTYNNTGLTSGLRYYYRVYFTNSAIDSSPSFVEYIDVP